MPTRVLLVLIVVAVAVLALRTGERNDALPRAAHAAVERALPLLQSSARYWTEENRCFSCHHQGFGSLAVALAREVGFAIDEDAAEKEADAVREYALERYEPLLFCDGIGIFGRGTTLLALGARARPRDDVTDVVARFVAARQTISGCWYSNEHRPPFEDSHVSATTLAVRALQLYGPAAETSRRIDRARRWLEEVEPRDSEERAMQLLGLAWCGSSEERIDRAARDIVAQQNDDGGWSQLETTASDPYATGQALAVLHQAAGIPADHPAWSRGARFLVDRQRADGSWLVRTRRKIKGLPMVDSGFPYRRSQFVSYFASTWATMALSLCASDAGRTRTLFGPAPERGADATAAERGLTALQRAAAFGTLDELRTLLARGARPDERGPRGATALMLAVHDLAKVELLLEHGADPECVSEWGFTPLLMASLIDGAQPTLRHLLSLGVSTETGSVNGASPMTSPATRGDVESVRALVRSGVSIDPRGIQNSLIYSACCDDVPMGRALLELGADVDLHAGKELTALTSAAIAGYTRFVELALEAGADTEVPDATGMTALAWAAKVDPGHSHVVELLLRAGADPRATSNDGRTPLDWALLHGNEGHARLLRAAAGE